MCTGYPSRKYRYMEIREGLKMPKQFTLEQTKQHLEAQIDPKDRLEEDNYAWIGFVHHVHETDWWGTTHEIYSAWSFWLAGYLDDKEY